MTTYNSHPTTKFLTKSRKPKNKSIYRWLRERTSSIDYGFKYDGHPIHCNPNEKVINAFNGGKWLSRMTNEKYDDHFSGEKTFYFTGNGSSQFSETLLNIDIDCHKTGSLAGAIAFAEHLKKHYFPDLYYEVSTNGNGVHAYVVIEKDDLGSIVLNGLFRRLEQHLRSILSGTNFDVEGVEVKGTCPLLVWGDKKGQLQNYTSGTLAKFPREAHRFEELRNTTRLSYRDLLKLPPVEMTPKRQTESNGQTFGQKVMAGSISGRVIGNHELGELSGHYLKVAKTLMETHVLKTSGRTVATIEDLAIFLMLLRFFTNHMNQDGSLPFKRFKRMWDAVYESGDINRSFECKRFAALRNYLSSLGLIDWTDQNYTLGTTCVDGKKIKGKAARWKASDLLMSLLDWQAYQKEQELSVNSVAVEEREGERTSLAVTHLRDVIRTLTRQSFLDIQRPVLSEDIPAWRDLSDQMSSLVMPFDECYLVAA